MDISFNGLIHNSIVVYLDDVTIFSKKQQDHFSTLKQVFKRCRKFNISPNPKKSIFVVTEGKLLGFIISKEGMIIDLECAEAISKVVLPNSHKEMKSFLGEINYFHIFVPNFSQVVKPQQFPVKKDLPFKWSDEQKNAFAEIQKTISEAPSLMSPNFNKDFLLYDFATDFSYAAILTQKNHEDIEIPISFMSSTFKGVELNYSEVDK